MSDELKQLSEVIGASLPQVTFANDCGVALTEIKDLEQLIYRIEVQLGQNTMLEQARWFVLSVLRHGNKKTWQDLSESNVADEQQYELAKLYIESDDLKHSLRTVLQDDRCRFTLLSFAKARNIDKLTLSTTTKAYKVALRLLQEAGLIKKPPHVGKKRVTRKRQDASGSAVNRRAARRGYFDDETVRFDEVEIQSPQTKREIPNSMSEEEYAELEQVIEASGDRQTSQNWSYHTNEDRLSLLMGLAAGCGVFVIVLLLFL
jgi:hypothetical protein